jgi:hypothetical protein
MVTEVELVSEMMCTSSPPQIMDCAESNVLINAEYYVHKYNETHLSDRAF